MREIIISKSESGMRLNKYIKKLFSDMPDSMIYKLLRKKYFEINDKKASGDELLCSGDKLSIFLGEETYNKFTGNVKDDYENGMVDSHQAYDIDKKLLDEVKDRIIYEDENVIIYNKSVGMLSQSDDTKEISVNELLKAYVIRVGRTEGDKCSGRPLVDIHYNPSVVNRLDRNTDGLTIFAKTYIAAREISEMIKNQKIEKYYKTIVNGIIDDDEGELIHLYKKDEKMNKALILDYKHNNKNTDGYVVVELKYKVIDRNNKYTKVDVNLITGKSHQIRAQFSHIGHPIVCDKKYMDAKLYDANVNEFGQNSQMLTCYKIKFGKFNSDLLDNISNKMFMLND